MALQRAELIRVNSVAEEASRIANKFCRKMERTCGMPITERIERMADLEGLKSMLDDRWRELKALQEENKDSGRTYVEEEKLISIDD